MSLGSADVDQLLEAVPDALVGVDQAGMIRFVNHQTEALFGYDADQLVGAPMESLVPESFRQAHRALRESYSAATATRHMGTELGLTGRRRDGTTFPADIALSRVETEHGAVVVAAVRDMTRYRRDETERRKADAMTAIVEHSGDAIIGKTLAGIVTSWNPAAERLYGYTANEMVGEPVQRLSPPERVDEIKTVLGRVSAGHSVDHLETTRVRKDGTTFPASLTVSPILDEGGTVVGASTIARDVSEQRRASEAARRMAALVESSGEAIVGVAPDGTITTWNPAAERTFGYSSQEVVGKSGTLLAPEGHVKEGWLALARMQAGGAAERTEAVLRRKDGTAVIVWLSISPIFGADGAVVGATAIASDITEQRRAFEATQRMAAIVEHSDDAINSCTLDGVITSWNPAAERLYGYTAEEVVGKPSQPVTPQDRAHEVKDILAAVSAGRPVKHLETTRVRKDGTMFPVLLTVSPIRDSRGGVIGASTIAHDVTSQRRDRAEIAEYQTRALERLEELERFQRLTVGRELKMIELKNENRRLADEVSRLAATARTPDGPPPGTQAGQAATSEYVGALLNLLEDATAENTRLKSRLDGAA
jgi:PAS domain S-box-containing protein